jgi:hypothetical protein
VEVETQEMVDVAHDGWDHLITSSPGQAVRGVLRKLSGVFNGSGKPPLPPSRF